MSKKINDWLDREFESTINAGFEVLLILSKAVVVIALIPLWLPLFLIGLAARRINGKSTN